MKNLLLFLFLFVLVVAVINIELVSAQATPAPDWQIGPGWNGLDTPTPEPTATPTPSPSPSPTPTDSPSASSTPLDVVANVFVASISAIGMFAVVPIISTAGLIISVTLMMRSGEEVDPKIIAAGVILVIVVNVLAVVGILIINGVNAAMPVA